MELSHFAVYISEKPVLSANPVARNSFRFILFFLSFHLGIEVNYAYSGKNYEPKFNMYCLSQYMTQLEHLSKEELLVKYGNNLHKNIWKALVML